MKVKARLHQCANIEILLFPYSKGTKIVCATRSSYSIWNIKYYNHIWAESEENLIVMLANKGADKPAQSVKCLCYSPSEKYISKACGMSMFTILASLCSSAVKFEPDW